MDNSIIWLCIVQVIVYNLCTTCAINVYNSRPNVNKYYYTHVFTHVMHTYFLVFPHLPKTTHQLPETTYYNLGSLIPLARADLGCVGSNHTLL